MAKYSRIAVAQTMEAQGMVPLFYHADVTLGKEVLSACYRGGSRLMEFTNRGDFAHEVFAELNRFALKELPGMMLGAGSVTDAGAASLYMQLGANFIVTPVLREDIAIVCNRKKVLWSPGCGSLTEIARAEELGAEIVKLFPGGIYGPGFIKDIKGPQPWTSIMPTGGVEPTEENLRAWLEAGAVCVGMGSKLISAQVLQHKDFSTLEQQVRATLELIAKIRTS
ncbi:MAG: bifunctional 4-hydroxy-2-oxoglutarate aldolase/2-dehydro-3-deoxy-phosphogluconate aldolase [Saprospiraceae bacterium]|jgi:2-dehydro-3-deoxyphosphogluconate aldolase / (4S)-4-hydroxy-2-oxoglutarate aldolase|nr:bifunctional 4-hydroxy-2-oxoglutarate aldolase/2-dehydro-3-deoxy-phosphogluconate aldolase [Saprospiraceae bacterium]MDP4999689.1 bifunctional 4-hydroxy-2-oxoglutarate aldolase/2-dehydro-3-deoxy-phosphogluconate aldolase [Saprospiraceae bacterium]